MCWNAPVSLGSFIIGICISMCIGIVSLKQKKSQLAILSFGWSWVLCMQLIEYFIWIYPDENKKYARWAFVFNITQILVLGLLFLTMFDHPIENKMIAGCILLVYTSYMLYYTTETTITTTITENHHLKYNWWDQLPYGGLLYIFSLCCIFLLLVRPFWWSFRTMMIIVLLLLISTLFYSDSVASMWCFFAVSVPILSYLSYF